MHQPLRTLVIAVVLVALLGVVYQGRQIIRHRDPRLREQDRVADQLREDRKVVRERRGEPSIVYSTVLRLGAFAQPEDKVLFLELARDKSPLFRAAAAEALGHLDDPGACDAIRGLLNDTDGLVRRHAATGLGIRPGKAREEALQTWLKSGSHDDQERVAGLGALMRISASPETRKSAISEVIALARTEESKRGGPDAIQTLLEDAPNEPESTRFFEEALQSTRPSLVQPLVIRGLAKRKSAWLSKNLGRFMESESALNRLEAVRALPFACPPDRWALLENRLRMETDRTVLLFALRAPEFMPGAEAEALFEKVIRSPSQFGRTGLKPDETKIAEEGLSHVKTTHAKDPCLP